jgi:peptide deformylase
VAKRISFILLDRFAPRDTALIAWLRIGAGLQHAWERDEGMAIRPIRILGEPGDDVLRQIARPVDQVDGSIQSLVDDMFETLEDAYGVGLAAPQIGVPLRIVVIRVPEVPPFALINGEVVRHGGKRWIDEGCLSIPGYRGELFRSVRVTVKGLDRKGRPIRIRAADDVLAQCLEHEIDHTNGLLYVDLLSGPEHLHRMHWDEEEPVEVQPVDESLNGAAEAPRVLPAYTTGRRRHGRPPLLTRARMRLRSRTG